MQYTTSIIINDEEKCLNFEESGLLTEYGDIKYYYDHLGRRYKKEIPLSSKSIEYFYEGDRLILQRLNNDEMNILYLDMMQSE